MIFKRDAHWWRFRLIELAVGVCLFAALAYIIDNVKQRLRDNVSPSAWLTVNDIHIPDYRFGDKPPMSVDRTVRETFQAFWIAEIQQRDGDNNFKLVCIANGVRYYEPGSPPPVRLVTDICDDLRLGEYRIRFTWIMRKPDWPEKTVVAYSNVFKVLP